jgi:hypothetical protein
MSKCPPAGEPGQLATPHSVAFAVSGDGRHEIKEIENDFGPRVRIDADRDERGKCIPGGV